MIWDQRIIIVLCWMSQKSASLQKLNVCIFIVWRDVFCWLLDRSLMIGWRKNPETLKVCSLYSRSCLSVCVSVCVCVCLSVCLSVCTRATEDTFWHRNVIFGSNDPWDMRKKRIFFVFRNLHFYAFYWHFSMFPLYNTSIVLFSSYRS